MKTFDEYTLKEAQEIVDKRKDEDAEVARLFFNGDHWQKGEGWIGPMPGGPNADHAVRQIEKAFISRNAVREVVTRHVTAVAGNTVHWKFTIRRELGTVEQVDPNTGATVMEEEQPTEEENNLIAEAESVLVNWWDGKEAQTCFQQATEAVLLGKRAILRQFVPPGERDDDGNVPAGDLEESLERIWLQHLGTNEEDLTQQWPSAVVYRDPHTRRDIGVFVYDDEDDQPHAELSYVDEDKLTVLRVLGREGDVFEPVRLDLGGRLLLYEMSRPAMITRQIMTQQRALNLAESMRARNDEVGGFLERLLLNAQLPGEYVDDPGAPDGKRFVPQYDIGPGHTTRIMGEEYEDEQGNIRRHTPSVMYRNPVPPDTFIRSSQAAYLNILAESNQLHYATAGDAAASGESRKQAREAYIADLNVTGNRLEAAVRWAMETALAMAAVFAGQPGRFEGLRVYAEARIESGPVSPDERRSAREMHDAGLWSKERAQSYTGVEDVDAENQRIDLEQNQGQPAQQAIAEPVAVPRGVEDIEAIINQNGDTSEPTQPFA